MDKSNISIHWVVDDFHCWPYLVSLTFPVELYILLASFCVTRCVSLFCILIMSYIRLLLLRFLKVLHGSVLIILAVSDNCIVHLHDSE